ncbi:MAG: tripartite tricarboxylate transporter substrate binding protein [SAR324 cluster bacterium]|nr:tripartite tricarboxylate transporter substrate binding protein [SAR324 cluster bacterium]
MMKKASYLLRAGILSAVAGAFLTVTASVAVADYPEKPITFIVPYSPGGGSDQQARRLQPGLEKELGVTIRIVYKTGGGGAVGFNELARSEPDGYSISNVVVPNIVISAKGKDVGYKPGDFSYIGMTARAVGALMVPKNSPYKTLDQFVAAAKANPGKLTVAGVGNTGEANFAELAKILGIETTYVPVSGGVGKMMPMLQGNHVDAGMTSSSHAVRHRATVDTLVIAGPGSSAALPGVPNEPNWTYITTWGVMAPPGTPADKVAILNNALNKATADPKVKEMVEKNGLQQMRQTPAEAKAYVEASIKKFSN